MGKTRKKMKIFRKENEIDSNESLRNSRKYYSHQVKYLSEILSSFCCFSTSGVNNKLQTSFILDGNKRALTR